jgi:hypothetical protein
MTKRSPSSGAALLFLLAPVVGSATSQIDRTTSNLFARAHNVVEGEVRRIAAACDNRTCTSIVDLAVTSSYKGKARSGDSLRFCTGAPLVVGSQYVFFVEATSSESRVGCDRYVERDGVLQRFSERVYRYMSPGSFALTSIDGLQYLTGWVEERDFDRALIARDDQSDYGAPSFDAALGAAIRAMAAYSKTCETDERLRDDPEIVGTLYGNGYIVLDRKKESAGRGSVYEYSLRGKSNGILLRAQVTVVNGACAEFTVEKAGGFPPH